MALKHVCAYCGKTIRDGKDGVSHGICKPCFEKFKREHFDNHLSVSDWLDPFVDAWMDQVDQQPHLK